MEFFNVTDSVRLLNMLNLLAIPLSVAFFLSCLMGVGRPVKSSSSELSKSSRSLGVGSDLKEI